jgi:hypothetical protein
VTVSIDAIEAIWIALNLSTFVLTAAALLDALADKRAVVALNGHARELIATGVVRRESLRLVVQGFLLAIIVPGLFDDRPTPLNFFVVILMAIPVVLLLSSVLDARDRRAMTVLVAADLLHDRADSFKRIETLITKTTGSLRKDIAENTVVSQQASDHADRAYHEANSVNEKIALQGEAITKAGEQRDADIRDRATDRAADAKLVSRVETTIDDTHEKVADLHDALPDT